MNAAETWTVLHLVATIITGVAFLVSGIAKARDIPGTATTFTVLGVPSALNRPWAHRTYPIAELAVGIGVLVAPSWLWWPASLAALALMIALVALTWRKLLSGDQASCNCFGVEQPITRRTVTRNLILLALAAIAVVAPVTAPAPLWTSPLPLAVGICIAVALACLLTTLSVAASPESAEFAERPDPFLPELPLYDRDGQAVATSSVPANAPHLIVHVKKGCSSCEEVIAHFAHVDSIAERVKVTMVEYRRTQDPAPVRDEHGPRRLWDADGAVMSVLGMRSTPSALLVAADGSIPANPVIGTKGIFELVEGIEEAVRSSQPSLTDIVNSTQDS